MNFADRLMLFTMTPCSLAQPAQCGSAACLWWSNKQAIAMCCPILHHSPSQGQSRHRVGGALRQRF